MNIFIVSGNLGQDPKIRITQAGKKMATFTIANSTGFGEYKKTNWFYCKIISDKLANVAEKYLSKGSKICIEGEMGINEYVNKKGENVKTTELLVRTFDMLDAKKDNIKPHDDIKPPAGDFDENGDVPF